MDYQLTIVERPSYLHATVTGANDPQNALRFLREAYEACVERGRNAVLLEMNLTGPSMHVASIFEVISQRSADGAKLRKIAYVDKSGDHAKAEFAETVAVNRAVNVRLFRDVEQAQQWLAEP